MLAGFHRINPTNHDLRLPITGDILKKILSSFPFITSLNFETKLMHTAFTLAFHGFLCIGEVAANSKSDIQPSVLRRSDVELGSMGGPGVIIINFRISKNNQFGSPQTVVVASQLNSILYSVLALQSYLQQAGDATTLFAHFDKSPITRFHFNEILKKLSIFQISQASSFLNLTHSALGQLYATAHMQGFSNSDIQVMGRWHSTAFKSYIQLFPLDG